MRCSDLQIGDWVLIKSLFGGYHTTPIKITAVHQKKVGYHKVPDKLNWARFGLLEPIPLTSEILRKNGFKEIEDDDCNRYILEDDEVEFYTVMIEWKDSYDNGATDAFNRVSWQEEWGLYISSKESEYNKTHCKIIFVHELQHALRLCGLNELADNLKQEE